MKASGVVLFLMLLSQVILSSEIKTILEIGAHQRIFTLEKNENPQNILAVYTQVDESCRFAPQPQFGFYWLMETKKYKPVHPLIRQGITKRISVSTDGRDAFHFHVKVEDLREMATDISDLRLSVMSKKQEDRCAVEAFINLGPSDHDAKIRLERIESVSKKTWLPPFRKIVSVSLKGVVVDTGAEISRTYTAK